MHPNPNKPGVEEGEEGVLKTEEGVKSVLAKTSQAALEEIAVDIKF